MLLQGLEDIASSDTLNEWLSQSEEINDMIKVNNEYHHIQTVLNTMMSLSRLEDTIQEHGLSEPLYYLIKPDFESMNIRLPDYSDIDITDITNTALEGIGQVLSGAYEKVKAFIVKLIKIILGWFKRSKIETVSENSRTNKEIDTEASADIQIQVSLLGPVKEVIDYLSDVLSAAEENSDFVDAGELTNIIINLRDATIIKNEYKKSSITKIPFSKYDLVESLYDPTDYNIAVTRLDELRKVVDSVDVDKITDQITAKKVTFALSVINQIIPIIVNNLKLHLKTINYNFKVLKFK